MIDTVSSAVLDTYTSPVTGCTARSDGSRPTRNLSVITASVTGPVTLPVSSVPAGPRDGPVHAPAPTTRITARTTATAPDAAARRFRRGAVFTSGSREGGRATSGSRSGSAGTRFQVGSWPIPLGVAALGPVRPNRKRILPTRSSSEPPGSLTSHISCLGLDHPALTRAHPRGTAGGTGEPGALSA